MTTEELQSVFSSVDADTMETMVDYIAQQEELCEEFEAINTSAEKLVAAYRAWCSFPYNNAALAAAIRPLP